MAIRMAKWGADLRPPKRPRGRPVTSHGFYMGRYLNRVSLERICFLIIARIDRYEVPEKGDKATTRDQNQGEPELAKPKPSGNRQ